MRTDMHIHTVASDGTWSPARLISEVKRKGIEIFAVTDHDSVASIKETQQLAREAGIYFLTGVEISTTLNGKLFHILAYGIDPANRKLQRLLQENTRLMNGKDDDSIRALISHGFDIDFARYLSYQNDTGRGGWKALNFLIDEGLCRDAEDFFANLFHKKHQISFPIFAPPQEVISNIVQAGGLPVLAHPAVNLYNEFELEDILEQFACLGIQGIECYHPQHDPKTTARCCAWSRRKGLQITGGSDCHGDFIPSRLLGFPHIEDDMLRIDRLKELFHNPKRQRC